MGYVELDNEGVGNCGKKTMDECSTFYVVFEMQEVP
jgi:hypothetical protein